MRQAAICTVLVAALAVPRSGAAAPGKVTQASVEELEKWIASVNAHVPGRGDTWVDATARLTYRRREDLSPAMTLFLAFFQQQKRQQKIVTKGPDEARVVDLARAVSQNTGVDRFLKRAAVLHSDAAILTERVGGIDDPTTPPPRARTTRMSGNQSVRVPEAAQAVPPLLTNSRFVISRDGEVIGEASANWNWPFARSLLDVLPEADPFIPAWYHAIAAYMLGNGLYAEATPHLERGVAALPNDPQILFDRGCYAEVFGLPMQQVLREDAKPWTPRASIPREDVTNADAAYWYRRALIANPAFAEARVRLGRLLDVNDEHEAALVEIRKALTENPKGVVAFYAHLFAGRAAQALGQLDEARSQFAQAAAWFPDAQSAALAQSQAALNAADVPAALTSLQNLGPGSGSLPIDPWWYYHRGAGRDLEDLLAALWSSVPRN
jgi:tetratricopeptide (TPR) repeat protein